MKKTPITTLFQKYLDNQINAEELQDLLRHFEQSNDGDDLTPLIREALDNADAHVDEVVASAIANRAEQRITERTTPVHALPNRPIRWINTHWLRIAAAILVIFAGGTYLYLKSMDTLPAPVEASLADIEPGSNRATLMLADGRAIDLSTAQSGIVVAGGIQYEDGTVVVADPQPSVSENERAIAAQVAALMSLSTPKGGQYRVTLPDGSNVWLNAASTLTYPSQFDGAERVVELEGEAYFEVAKNEHQPFFVKSGGQLVKVVGTAFNINAYPDETEVTTTLIEGVIAIGEEKKASSRSTGFGTILKPGQQASFVDGLIEIADVEVSEYVAWKNGRFVFYGERLPVVIREIERWYDVSFEAKNLTVGIELWGSLSREVTLSQILDVIELNTPLTFKREGRRIFIGKE